MMWGDFNMMLIREGFIALGAAVLLGLGVVGLFLPGGLELLKAKKRASGKKGLAAVGYAAVAVLEHVLTTRVVYVLVLFGNAVWLAGSAAIAASTTAASATAASATSATTDLPYQTTILANLLRDSLVAAQAGLLLVAASLVIAEDGHILSVRDHDRPGSVWRHFPKRFSARWAWIASLLITGLLANGLALVDSLAQIQLPEATRAGWPWMNIATIALCLVGAAWAFFSAKRWTFFDFDRWVGAGAIVTLVIVGGIACAFKPMASEADSPMSRAAER